VRRDGGAAQSQMSDNDHDVGELEPLTKRVYIISSATLQTKALAELVSERAEVECFVRSELRRTATTVSVGNAPTIILVDSLFLPPVATLQQLEQLPARLASNVMVALMNLPRDEDMEVRAVAQGIRGLFYSNIDIGQLISGITTMFEGDVWVSRRILASAVFTPERSPRRASPRTKELLTRRERQILSLISIGASNDEIADRLNISSNTVRTHVYNLYRKISVPNRMQAALWGAENL
jgi:DNA-binding NarL/FixJ family response regulator